MNNFIQPFFELESNLFPISLKKCLVNKILKNIFLEKRKNYEKLYLIYDVCFFTSF